MPFSAAENDEPLVDGRRRLAVVIDAPADRGTVRIKRAGEPVAVAYRREHTVADGLEATAADADRNLARGTGVDAHIGAVVEKSAGVPVSGSDV